MSLWKTQSFGHQCTCLPRRHVATINPITSILKLFSSEHFFAGSPLIQDVGDQRGGGGGGGKVVGLIGTNVGQEELKIGLKIATAHLHKTSNRDNVFEKLRRQIDRLPGFPFSNLLKACKAELNLYFPRACSNFDLQRQVFKCPRGGEMRDIEKN